MDMFKYNFKNVIALSKQCPIFSIISVVLPKNRFVGMEPLMVNFVLTSLGHGIQIFGQTQV